VRRGVGVLRVGRREEGGGSDEWGPLGSDVRGNTVDGLRKLEEEAPFGKYAKAAQAEWAEWAERAHGGLRAKWSGCLGLGRMGQKKEATVSRRGRKTKLTAQPHLAKRREGGGQLGRREPKGKTYSREDTTDVRARWAGRGSFSLWGQRGQWAG
jgi:hypothetical protein